MLICSCSKWDSSLSSSLFKRQGFTAVKRCKENNAGRVEGVKDKLMDASSAGNLETSEIINIIFFT